MLKTRNIYEKVLCHPQTHSGWRPSYLRRRVLIVFVAIFCGIIAALEVLNHVSEAHDGLASSVEGMHYTWTYGPTAILTIVAAFWSRVEYQAKQNAPWHAMREHPQEARKSVLLDYVSDMLPLTFIQATWNKHYVPAAGIVCSMLLRLLIVFSTGLFSLQQTPMRRHGVPIHLLGSFNTTNPDLESAGLQPYELLNAIVFENLSYPEGTNADLTFQQPLALNISSDTVFGANVHGLAADLDCEPATVSIKYWELVSHWSDGNRDDSIPHENISLATPSCTIPNVRLDEYNGDEKYRYTATLVSGQCDHTTGSDGMRVVMALADIHKGVESAPYDIRKANKSATTYYDRQSYYTTSRNLTLNRSIQLICKPTLSMITLQAQVNSSQSSKAQLQKIASRQFTLPGLNAWDVAKETLSFSHMEDSGSPVEFIDGLSNVQADQSVKFGLYITGLPANVETLFEDGVLQTVVSSYYRALSAQIMHLNLVNQRQSITTGYTIVNENRVKMTHLSLRVIESALGLMILAAIVLGAKVPRKRIAAWDPNNISATAAIMANSESFRQSLRGTGATSLAALEGFLSKRRFFTEQTSTGFSIEIEEPERLGSESKENEEYLTWKPLPNLMLRIAVFIVVAICIAVLECLLRLSRANKGLGDVPNDGYLHYSWTIGPALVLVSIGLVFGSIDFNTRCLSPYASLKQSTGSTLEQSLRVNFLDSLAISNIFQSIRLRQFAVLTTTLSTVVASFLTIISSGLYSPIEIPRQTAINLTQDTLFTNASQLNTELNSNQNHELDAGITIAGYLLRDNLTYPQWTYNELAFPKLSIQDHSDGKPIKGDFVDVQVPALRSALNCTFLTSSELHPTPLRLNTTTSANGFNYEFIINFKSGPMRGSQVMPVNPEGYFGSSTVDYYADALHAGTHQVKSYIWGYMGKTAIQHIAGLYCVESAETVDTQTRFQLPGLNISDSHPPVPDESSARAAENVPVPYSSWLSLYESSDTPPLDEFFQVLVSGKYAIPIEDLGNPDQDDKVTKTIMHQHKLIKAQQFNSFLRHAANGALNDQPLPGQITSSHLRLIQDEASTRILEALLASMLVLGILSSVLMNTDHILPKNPCSIAAMASLLADSNFLDRYSFDTGDANDGLFGRSSFANCRFFLGWLGGGSEESGMSSSSSSTDELGAKRGKTFTIYFTDSVGGKSWGEGDQLISGKRGGDVGIRERNSGG